MLNKYETQLYLQNIFLPVNLVLFLVTKPPWRYITKLIFMFTCSYFLYVNCSISQIFCL